MATALLVIDAQVNMFAKPNAIYNADGVLNNDVLTAFAKGRPANEIDFV